MFFVAFLVVIIFVEMGIFLISPPGQRHPSAALPLDHDVRIPTADDWHELISHTTERWTAVNVVKGRKFTAVNGNALFLPATGCRYGTELYLAGDYGYYWSSSLYADAPYSAMDCLYVSGWYGSRGYGFTVRAVRQP